MSLFISILSTLHPINNFLIILDESLQIHFGYCEYPLHKNSSEEQNDEFRSKYDVQIS